MGPGFRRDSGPRTVSSRAGWPRRPGGQLAMTGGEVIASAARQSRRAGDTRASTGAADRGNDLLGEDLHLLEGKAVGHPRPMHRGDKVVDPEPALQVD